MIHKIFEWAWINGLDVRLHSESFALPVMTECSFNPRREAPNFVQHNRVEAHRPVLIFSRGDRNMRLVASSWAEMMAILEYRQHKIFAELCCEPMSFRSKGEQTTSQ